MKRRAFFSKCAGFVAGCFFGVGLVPKPIKLLAELDPEYRCVLVYHDRPLTITSEIWTAVVCNPKEVLVIENISD